MRQVKHVYSKTREHVFQTDYQYMSEDDMKAAGWSEIPLRSSRVQKSSESSHQVLLYSIYTHPRKKIAGVKRHCAQYPGYIRRASAASSSRRRSSS